MTRPWLLLDVSYLAYRAFFSMGKNLSHQGVATGVVYGILREVQSLQETFATNRIAFCFDYGRPLRCDILSTYKQKRRKNQKPEQVEALKQVGEQLPMLRKEYLTEIGFRNLLFQKGYEADDVIAKVIADRPDKEFVIVSTDHDLFQLLGENVCMWNPTTKERYTYDHFVKQWGLEPQQWIDVKAIAGCSTDEIPGIFGIGEGLAAMYLRSAMASGKRLDSIQAGKAIIKRNRKLVRLPFPDIQEFRLVKDEVTASGWNSLTKRLGMNSLVGSIPGVPRRAAQFTRATLRKR